MPQPEGPSRKNNSPGSIERLMLLTAAGEFFPPVPGKDLQRSWMRMPVAVGEEAMRAECTPMCLESAATLP